MLVGRNAESQPIRRVSEGAGEDSRGEQPLKGGAGVGVRGQSKQARSADDSPFRRAQEGVEPRSLLAEAGARFFQPVRIGERLNPDRNRRPADRPRPQGASQGGDDVERREREAEPKPGQSIGLAERAQHDRAACRQHWREALLAIEIGEGLVDDERSPAPRKAFMQRQEVVARRYRGRPGCWD